MPPLSSALLRAALVACALNFSSPAVAQAGTPSGYTPPSSASGSGAGSSSSSAKGLGINLPGINDWSRSLMFADLMKQARAWGGPTTGWIALPPEALDGNGWPKQDAAIYISTVGGPTANEPDAPYVPPGTYTLSFQGIANVTAPSSPNVSVKNVLYNPGTNISEGEVEVGQNATQLVLKFVNTNGGVKNVGLLRPGYKGTGKVFSDEFVTALAPFNTLRAMDFLATNGSPVVSWNERTTPQSATQAGAKGGAWEHLIALSNQTGKDLWINIPNGANDQYVLSLAQLIKSTLSPARRVYVEHSNELWNSVFQQTKDNRNAAVSEVYAGNLSLTDGRPCSPSDFANSVGSCNIYIAGMKRVAAQTVRISKLFAQVYGAASMNTRIRPVLGGQYVNPWGIQVGLDYIVKNYGAPSKYIYGLATAPYYTLGSLSTSTTLTLPQIFSAFDTSLQNNIYPMFGIGMFNASWVYVPGKPYDGGTSRTASPQAIARYYGLKSLAYEGGPDYGQNTNALALKHQSNNNPMMGTQMSAFLLKWYGCGNDLFVYFSLVGAYGKYGYWGLSNDILRMNTPKFQSLQAVSPQVDSAKTCL